MHWPVRVANLAVINWPIGYIVARRINRHAHPSLWTNGEFLKVKYFEENMVNYIVGDIQ